MDSKLFWTVLGSVFLAEIGDKTQLATLLFAADAPTQRWTIFAAATFGILLAVGLAVFAGEWVGRFVAPETLKRVAGIGFIAIGIWTLAKS